VCFESFLGLIYQIVEYNMDQLLLPSLLNSLMYHGLVAVYQIVIQYQLVSINWLNAYMIAT